MRKTIFTIGVYVICLSVFTFCNVSSWATPNEDIIVNNAIGDLRDMEGAVRDQRDEVQDAWAVVDLISSKWATVSDENRRKTVANFLIEMMGSGFWATAGGLEGRIEAEFESYYRTRSLMDLYSDELENVESEIDWFYEVTVPLYNSAHKIAVKTVNSHHTNYHDTSSASNVNHFVPTWSEKTCRDDLPSFLCQGNVLASGTCEDTYDTPNLAYYTHQKVCGTETPPPGYTLPIAGDGIIYYTCDENGSANHTLRICQNLGLKWNPDTTSYDTVTCNMSYRNCQNTGGNCFNGQVSDSGVKHRDDVNPSNSNAIVISEDPRGALPSTSVLRPCGHPVSASGDHSLQASCSTDTNCISTNFYLCQHDSHDYGCRHTPVHAKVGMPCGTHSDYSCQQTEHQLLSCPTDQGRTCEYQIYYACSPHTHAYSGEALRPCGHPMTASGDHRVTRFSSCGHYGYLCDTSHQSTRCPPGPNGETCSVSGGLYLPCSAASHTHTYPKGSTPKPPQTQQPPDTQTPRETQQPTVAYHPCGVHAATESGDHSLQARCTTDSRCIATDFYSCRHSSHTYSDPPPVVCPADSRTNCGGTVSHAARCGQGHTYYTCSTSDVLQHSGHTQNDDSNDDSNDDNNDDSDDDNNDDSDDDNNDDSDDTDTPPPVTYEPCGIHTIGTPGTHTWVSCPTNASGQNCSSGGSYACQSHTHSYPAGVPPRPCGHSQSSRGNHSWVACPTNASGQNCTVGSYYACQSHTHSYPARVPPRPCGHSQSSGGNHSWVACPTNASGQNCTVGSYYACQSHTHKYPALPVVCPADRWTNCGGTVSHATTCAAGHPYYTCNPDAVRAHAGHTAARPCGHSQSAAGNHSWRTCPTNASGQNCTSGGAYVCQSHRHSYPSPPSRRPCGHSQSAAGNHSKVSCPSGTTCSPAYAYACQSHTHTYDSSENNSSSNTTRVKKIYCSGCRQVVSSASAHRTTCGQGHSYYRCNASSVRLHSGHSSSSNNSSTNNSSGNNSSSNNSSSNNSSSNNSSSNNSSGNNSSSNNSSSNNAARIVCPANRWTRCGGTTSHATQCRRGHTYYTCNPRAVSAHKWH